MKNKKLLKTTTSNQVYKACLIHNTGCPICGLGKGCNRNRDRGVKPWKESRKTQWKEYGRMVELVDTPVSNTGA